MTGNIACILIHGFGGDTGEIEPLAAYLENLGYEVRRTRLAGHTGRRREMKHATHRDWIRSAEDDYLDLYSDYEKIILIGFSTGGLIAANLAANYPAAAVITISTPIYVWDFKRILANLSKGVKERSMESLKWYAYSAFSFPLASLIHFKLLLHKSKRLFSLLNCPLYVLQGLDDDTVHRKSADFIYRSSPSGNKHLDYFEPSGHVMLKGPASDEAIRKIVNFIETI